MKSMIVVLAIVGGIGIGAMRASAGDAANLSCITEVDKAGKTIRDCTKDQEEEFLIAVIVEDETPPDSTIPRTIRGGGREHDGRRRGGGEPGGGQSGGESGSTIH